ncbi:MAG: GntR family transcriptional regulator [Synergistota bacterium]|nr:GntR family transcriptional regulator [Synergistota bacterium]
MRTRKKDLAYKAIKQMIMDKELTEEHYVSENNLAKKLDMSRTPVREALLRLQSEGFINIIPNKGAVVSNVSVVIAKEFYDMRMAIEEFVVRNVADRLTQEHLEHMDLLLKEQEKACEKGDLDGYLRADSEFHDYFLLIYENQTIWDAILQVRQRFHAVGVNVLSTQKDIWASLAYHKEIVDALKQGDVERAVQVTHDHLKFGKANLIR